MTIPTLTSLQVYKTQDYNRFDPETNPLKGNRGVDPKHVRKLKDSMEINYYPTIIQVNESGQIIDGQHRFRAIKELGLDMYYVVIDGGDLKNVQFLNSNSSNWTLKSFLDSYCTLGNENYLSLRDIMSKYKSVCSSIGTYVKLTSVSDFNISEDFRNGSYEFSNEDNTREILDMMLKYSRIFDSKLTRVSAFILAMNEAIRSPNFKMANFEKSIKVRAHDLEMIPNQKIALETIYDIHDHKTRIGQKVTRVR